MNNYTRDNIILAVLFGSILTWSVLGIGFLIAFGATMNVIFLLIALTLFVCAFAAGRAYTAFVVEVRANKPERHARSHRRHAVR